MQKEKKPTLKGIALIVQYKETPYILTLKELEDHPEVGKVKGMASIPMETTLKGETDEETIKRLIEEELSGMKIEILYPMGTYNVISAKVNLYVGKTNNLALPKDNEEVGDFRWMPPSIAIYLNLRPGAREMILDYYSKRIKEC